MTSRPIALALAALMSAATLRAQSPSADQGSSQPASGEQPGQIELHPLSDQDRTQLQNRNPPPQTPAKTPDQVKGGGGRSGGESPYNRGLVNIRTAHAYGEETILVRCEGQRWRLTVPPSAWCCPVSDAACIDQMDDDGETKYFAPLSACPYGSIFNRAYRKCQAIKEVLKIDGCMSPCLAKWLLDKNNAAAQAGGQRKQKASN